jgi:uncharacterized protein
MKLTVLTLFVVLLCGCASSPTVQFYTLSADAQTGSDLAAGDKPRIAVGPITLPDVVDRPQVVVRAGANQVNLTEEHRWAESLKTGIPRVIGENLSHLLSTREVWAYPQMPIGPVDYKVQVAIQRFESFPGQSAAIDALWTVQSINGERKDVKTGRSSVQQPVAGQGYDAVAAAHSRALAAISREIAEAIRTSSVSNSR